ncbi:MAG: FkbM family methyltransferase [Verrucomicrobiales bacterium]|nr:FkbM family methyltransferase [Verrucomicrobiales bacterium]
MNSLSGGAGDRVWTKVNGGVVSARLDDYVGRSAFYTGDIDRKITWVCDRIVRKGDTVLDIGANIGIFTIGLSRLVGQEGKVYSFEPNRELVEILKETIKKNNLTNVSLQPFALGRAREDRELFVPKGNAGAASLISPPESAIHESMKVSVNSLSDFVADEGIRSIRFMKIDVEGFELDVLEGGLRVLDDVNPDAILFECNLDESCRAGDIPVYSLLKNHDYSILAIPRCFLKVQLRELPSDEILGARGYDFLAVRQGRVFDEISRLVKVR